MPDMHDLRRKKKNDMRKNCFWLFRSKESSNLMRNARCDESWTLDMTASIWSFGYAISIAAEI